LEELAVPVSAHDKEMSAGSLVEFYEAVKTIHDKWHREDEQRTNRCGEKFCLRRFGSVEVQRKLAFEAKPLSPKRPRPERDLLWL
jgi:hypothetical protein